MQRSGQGGMVRAGVAATLRENLARYPKVRADRLILASGIDPNVLGDPDAMIDQAQWVDLLETAARETGDPCFAIELASRLPWKDLGVLGYVVLHSPTIGAALENACRFLAIQTTAGKLVLEVKAQRALLHYTIEDPRIVEAGQNTESTFALLARLVREATKDAHWGPREIWFRHDGPADPARHERFFRAPVKFRQKTSTVVIASSDLVKTSGTADAGLLPHLMRHAAECLAKMPKAGELSETVRRAVIAAISAGEPAIEDVAARLGMSGRSLQRRLQDEGLSFKAVVEETRLALAQRYLADKALTLTETGFLLGYSDLSAFSRAFRRWTGTTALAYRKQRIA